MAGAAVQGGLYGIHPSIPKDKRRDLQLTKKSIDFRQRYATVLGKWLGADPKPSLKKDYEQLKFLA